VTSKQLWDKLSDDGKRLPPTFQDSTFSKNRTERIIPSYNNTRCSNEIRMATTDDTQRPRSVSHKQRENELVSKLGV
jgi:hypothetical protein